MPHPTEERYMVCIGVNLCPFSKRLKAQPLDYAEKDAETVYNLLLEMGFKQEKSCLLTGENATLQAINSALREWVVNTPQRHDVVVVYFAGHGLPLLGRDEEEEADAYSEVFLAPYDFDEQRIREDRGFRKHEALGMERLRNDFFTDTRSNKVLFIFDSCYSGDFFGPRYRSGAADPVQGRMQQVFAKETIGARIALLSCLPGQKARESSLHAHGLFTHYLLEALKGDEEALDNDGWLTAGRLVEYISKKMPEGQQPVRAGVEHGSFKLVHYPDKAKSAVATISREQELRQEQDLQRRQAEKGARLKAKLPDTRRGVFHDRLLSFVGRKKELAEVRQHIAAMLPSGGYVTITGQAGQGKSSIIAKLVDEYGPEQVAFHFIPFYPGPEHRIELLNNLMARLILKYDLSDLYLENNDRAALSSYFPRVLEELVLKGGQEVIFIDGLDQLEEEHNRRDLSFLPENPPEGVVFVLGTRPDDTLKPLRRLKPYIQYRLPEISRDDFDEILRHRGVPPLSRELADRFYEVMQKNALYLDLVAKVLAETQWKNPVEVIERVADDPDNIFALSLDRLKLRERQWSSVLKPLLGLLLAASEPLTINTIRNVLRIGYDEVRDGLQRLGGLVAEDGQGRRYLYHIRFREYLRQDRNRPHKEYVFADDDVERWHKRLAAWCEQSAIEQIWSDVDGNREEQERREYARKHYITHLYHARQWSQLWRTLDRGSYGRAKVRYDPSMRSYIQDLDLGRQAAAWEEGIPEQEPEQQMIDLLPRVWRYTLLRGSLTSRADSYPESALELLVLLGREREAVGLAELLTDSLRRVWALLGIARSMMQFRVNLKQEGLQMLLRALQLAHDVEDHPEKFAALRALGLELVRAEQWSYAQDTGSWLVSKNKDSEVLCQLGFALVRAEQWRHAQEVCMLISEPAERFEVQCRLYVALVKKGQREAVQAIIDQIEAQSNGIEYWRDLVLTLIAAQQWGEAEAIARRITWSGERDEMLEALGLALVQAGEWTKARTLALSLEDWDARFRILRELGIAYAQAGKWKYARIMLLMIENKRERAEVLYALGLALAQAAERRSVAGVLKLIERDWHRVAISVTLGSALYNAGEWTRAAEIWEQCTANIHDIAEPERQAQAWIMLGKALARTRHEELKQRTLSVWMLAESAIRKITKGSQRIEAWIELGEAQAETQYNQEARAHWEQAEAEITLRLPAYDPIRESLMLRVCRASIRGGDWEQAARLLPLITHHYPLALEQLCEALAALPEQMKLEALVQIVTEIYTVETLTTTRIITLLYDLGKALAYRHEWSCVQKLLARKTILDDFFEISEAEIEQKIELLIALAESGNQRMAHDLWSGVEDEIHKREKERAGEEQTIQALRGLVTTLLAEKAWEHAQNVIRAIEQTEQQTEALQDLLVALINEREWERFAALIKTIDLSNLSMLALRDMGKALAQAQQWEHAETIIDLIRSPAPRAEALHTLGGALFQAQQEERAARAWEEGVRMILSSGDQGQFGELDELILDLVKARQWQSLAKFLLPAQETEYRLTILPGLLSALHQVMAEKIPETTWDEISKALPGLKDRAQRDAMRRELIAVLIQARQWERAEAAIIAMEPGAGKAVALRDLGEALAQGQQWERAERVWTTAAAEALSISNNLPRVTALQDLGRALVQAQRLEQALSIWQGAEETAMVLDDGRQRAKALKDLGDALAQAQQGERAIAMWQKALDTARKLESSQQREDILQGLARAFMQAQQWRQAQMVVKEIDADETRARILNELVDALLRAQQWQLAEKTIQMLASSEWQPDLMQALGLALTQAQQWEEGERIIASIERHKDRVVALHNLGITLLRMRQHRRADAVLSVAKEIIQELERAGLRAARLHDLAIALVQEREWERAEALIGGIEARELRIDALLELGAELVKAGQQARTDAVWRQVEILARSLDRAPGIIVMDRLTRALIEAQQWERADELVKQMQPGELEPDVLLALGKGLIQAQQWEQAAAFLERMKFRARPPVPLVTTGKTWIPDKVHMELQRLLRIELIRARQWERVDELIRVFFSAHQNQETIQSIQVTLLVDDLPGQSRTISGLAGTYPGLLLELGSAFEHEGQRKRARVIWKEFERVIQAIERKAVQARLIYPLAETLDQVGDSSHLLHLLRYAWVQASTRDQAINLLPLAYAFIPLSPEIGSALCSAFSWVDSFLKG